MQIPAPLAAEKAYISTSGGEGPDEGKYKANVTRGEVGFRPNFQLTLPLYLEAVTGGGSAERES